MFFDKERIGIVRQMILAEDDRTLMKALASLELFQTADFKGILSAMAGLPVTVRLLDPPLHEFLPSDPEELASLAEQMGRSLKEVQERVSALHETNPMLGHRGCRLGVTSPVIYEMQVRALMTAAVSLHRRGIDVHPEIMVPLVSGAGELAFLKARIEVAAEGVFERMGARVGYKIGTMIELPRAALTAGEIAEHAEFFSFGTNDLTQTTYGLSRDDMARFVFAYYDNGIWSEDPFKTLDTSGVGRLVTIGLTEGRKVRPDLTVGICGEHGGDPKSIAFCANAGLNYVSCSPFRVPVARLAAAQAIYIHRES